MANVRTTTTVKWDGDKIRERAQALMSKTTFEIGLFFEGQAKLLAPVQEGRLRGSIHTVSWDGQESAPRDSADKISQPSGTFDTHVGTNLEYAPYVEYGTGKYVPEGRKTPWSYQDAKGQWHTTSGMPAQPYLRPAVDIAYGRVPTIVEKNGKIYFKEYLNET